MSIINTPAATFGYRISGRSDAPWLVCSHSLATDSRMWDAQLSVLERSFRVLGLDLPGHGDSSLPPAPWTMEQLGVWTLEALDALDVDRFHWLGLSLGGMVGQAIALAAPGRVLSLVLADATSAYPPEAAGMWADRAASARAGGMVAVAEGTLGRWFTPAFLEARPEVVDRFRHMILATPAEGFARTTAAIAGMRFTGRLGAIACPCLVVVGAQDQATTPAHSEALARGIPGATLTVLPDAAHLSAVEQPEAFNEALESFYRHMPAQAGSQEHA